MKMFFHIINSILFYTIVYTVAFEDLIYVYGEGNKEMSEQGRVQYQIIRDRGSLPKYGTCWQAALEHLHDGCRHLSEDTQSDMALHITNCFLGMSGHETYNCELDKKPNLRGICINSMSDRAFNVYTEFYTHTQNICWFLRGQIWHEQIAENTLKVGKQLKISAQNQEDLLKIQKESIELQDKMLQQGKFLEKVLEDVYISTRAHQEILKLLTQSVTSLQTWIVGEISWIDSIIFNVFALFLVFILTSSQRTLRARLPLFCILFLNLALERLICSLFTKYSEEYDTKNLYSNIYSFVWYSRYAFTFLGAIVMMYFAFTYQDMFEQNVSLLNTIKRQNKEILRSIEKSRHSTTPTVSSTNIDFTSERDSYGKTTLPGYYVNPDYQESTSSISKTKLGHKSRECSLEATDVSVNSGFQSSYTKRKLFEKENKKYSLRSHSSRQGTPDSGVVH